jgi:hypothetical protein
VFFCGDEDFLLPFFFSLSVPSADQSGVSNLKSRRPSLRSKKSRFIRLCSPTGFGGGSLACATTTVQHDHHGK